MMMMSIGGQGTLLIAIIPMNIPGMEENSMKHVYPVVIADITEENIEQVTTEWKQKLSKISGAQRTHDGQTFNIEFKTCCDLKGLWTILDLGYIL